MIDDGADYWVGVGLGLILAAPLGFLLGTLAWKLLQVATL